MNAPARRQGLDEALSDAFDPSLPDPAFADRLGRLAAALTDADGAVVLDAAGDACFQQGAGTDKLVQLARTAQAAETGQAREDRRLALQLDGFDGRLTLCVQIGGGARALALGWERMLFLQRLSASRREASIGPFEPELLEDIARLAKGDWRVGQSFVDHLRRLAKASDVALAKLDGDVIETIVIASQPGLISAAPAQDEVRQRLTEAASRGDVLGDGAVRYAISFSEDAGTKLIPGLKGLFALPKTRPSYGLARRLRAPVTVLAVLTAIGFVPVPDQAELSAKVASASQREVTAPVTATLTEFLVTEGDIVSAGEVIARFDDGDLRLSASGERANLAAALSQFQTARRERNAAVQKDLELEIAQIEARLALITAELTYYEIVAPIDGIVAAEKGSELIGARLALGEMLARLSSPEDLRVEAWLTEEDRARAAVGDSTRFRPDARPGDHLDIQIGWISPVAEEFAGVTAFKAFAALPERHEMREGMEGVLAIDQEYKSLGLLIFKRLERYARRLFWL